MTMLRHPVMGVLMALMLVLTGQSMAIARGTPGPSGEMVLCTGTGPITVLVDENGQPVGRAHICPDCAFAFFAAHWDAPDLPARAPASLVPLRPGAQTLPDALQVPVPQARGPPVLS
ncbi:hypothetical protein [Lutimaribacter saemankumensis]|uniref:DUF2946 family protein n=1 Tax=Lutimaribacter saemankumensis TaxID=490829 RepID=A0A1G8M978_9RHOB|nr:hypothetical protein [Lutimaribacter saemankumensis]SDI64478.1 hypothetical protein SAMN05421850_10496 [Lutimaribacter saemankumensis]